MTSENQQILHGTAISWHGKGCLILGPSGSGKSGLALQLLALGAELIADDRVSLRRSGDVVEVSAPSTLPRAIEARRVGLLSAQLADPAPLVLVVDLGHTETDRLPQPKHVEMLGIQVPAVHNVEMAHFPFALIHYLKNGFADL